MRQVRGVAAAREALRRIPLENDSLPAQVTERLRRVFGEGVTPEAAVERIIRDVASRGDKALIDYARSIDGVELAEVRVPARKVGQARRQLEPALLEALELAAERIRSFHRDCLPQSWFDAERGLGQRFTPVESVGVYVPGGAASYPSTVLHTVIPARVAGVKTVIMATPPGRGGEAPPAVLAAAGIAGVDVVLRVGGAQAIAAMAWGTESVPRVDKIVGPGNLFVTIAKRKLFGVVGIDGLHGPTETLLVADDSASAEGCAADLLAQAEHDALATPVLITTSERVFRDVAAEIQRQLGTLERREIAREALERRGVIALVSTVEEAIDLANQFAPEHLCLLVRAPGRWVERVRHAGGLFLGEGSPEVLGDYVAGPSHTMPTGGTARFASAMGVHDFLKVTSVIGLGEGESRRLAGVAARIARAEGLTAHARAAELRAGARAVGLEPQPPTAAPPERAAGPSGPPQLSKEQTPRGTSTVRRPARAAIGRRGVPGARAPSARRAANGRPADQVREGEDVVAWLRREFGRYVVPIDEARKIVDADMGELDRKFAKYAAPDAEVRRILDEAMGSKTLTEELQAMREG